MDILQRFSVGVSSVFNPLVSELRGQFSGHKNVDCVFIVGPEMGDSSDRLQRLARSQGLSYVIIGDGENPVTPDMITKAKAAGTIGPDTEIFCNMHGQVKGAKANRQHRVQLDKDAEPMSTRILIELLRQPVGSGRDPVDGEAPWGGNVHLVSCHAGHLKDEFKPSTDGQTGLWEQGAVFIHGGKKFVHDDTGYGDIETVVREIGLAKRMDGRRPDNLQIMRALMANQAETVTLVGGDLEAPLTLHAPKSVKEIMCDDLQARWREQGVRAKLDLLDGRISGPDKQRAALMDAKARTEGGPVRKRLATRVLFSRLLHLRNKEKLETLLADMKSLPGLTHLRDATGFTPLLVYASLPRDKTLSVRRHEVAEKLVKLGVDVNATDRYGRSAIHFAARSGDLEMFDTLLKLGADLSAVDRDGESVFHYLANAPKGLGSLILKRLADDKALPNPGKKNKHGQTATDIARDAGADSTFIDMMASLAARPRGLP